MTGKEFKALVQRLESLSPLSFSPQAKDEITELLLNIIWSARSGVENRELTIGKEIQQIPDDFVFPEDTVRLIKQVETIWRKQSPFVSA